MKKILKLTTIVALIAQSVFLSPLASAAIDEPTSANPALPSGVCGLDIVLVMDQSQSMSAGEMSDQKESFKSIINEFAGIPTQFAVTKFSNRSQVVSQFTDDTAALIASIDAIANNSPAGESNWDAALTTARNRFDPRADKPDLIIFATDGIANRYKTNNNPSRDCDGSSAAACDAAYNHAIRAANLAKTDGVRILGVGQGLNNTVKDNLKLVTGPMEFGVDTNNIEDADVFFSNSSDFASLGAALAEHSLEGCAGTITVKKELDTNGVIADGGAGWMFDVAGTASVTDATSLTTPVSTFGTATVVEINTMSGYALAGAACVDQFDGAKGTLSGNIVTDIDVLDDDIITCTFTNQSICGDGIMVSGEACDDGLTGSVFCTTSCEVINHFPTAGDDVETTIQDMAAEIDFFSNDSYGLNGTGSINLTGTVAASGVVNLLAGVMTYIPNAGFIGSDSFQYEVCDADGDCEVATVTMTVTIPPSQGGGGGSVNLCGNGIIDQAREECDLGSQNNGQNGATCSAVCRLTTSTVAEEIEGEDESTTTEEEETSVGNPTTEAELPPVLLDTGNEEEAEGEAPAGQEVEPFNIRAPVFIDPIILNPQEGGTPINIRSPLFNNPSIFIEDGSPTALVLPTRLFDTGSITVGRRIKQGL